MKQHEGVFLFHVIHVQHVSIIIVAIFKIAWIFVVRDFEKMVLAIKCPMPDEPSHHFVGLECFKSLDGAYMVKHHL